MAQHGPCRQHASPAPSARPGGCRERVSHLSTVYPTSVSRRAERDRRRAACVTCDTAAVRNEILALDLVPAERVVVVPIGAAAVFSSVADPAADREAAR